MRRKRQGDLFRGIVSLGNLFAAAKKALRGRSLRLPGVMFLADLEPEVVRLARELQRAQARDARTAVRSRAVAADGATGRVDTTCYGACN